MPTLPYQQVNVNENLITQAHVIILELFITKN